MGNNQSNSIIVYFNSNKIDLNINYIDNNNEINEYKKNLKSTINFDNNEIIYGKEIGINIINELKTFKIKYKNELIEITSEILFALFMKKYLHSIEKKYIIKGIVFEINENKENLIRKIVKSFNLLNYTEIVINDKKYENIISFATIIK